MSERFKHPLTPLTASRPASESFMAIILVTVAMSKAKPTVP
jgi:hypothetical protein